jgi:hypothetical protein
MQGEEGESGHVWMSASYLAGGVPCRWPAVFPLRVSPLALARAMALMSLSLHGPEAIRRFIFYA